MSAVFVSAGHAVGRWAMARPPRVWPGRVRELRARRPPLAGGERVCWRGRSGAGQRLVASQPALYLREVASQAAAWSRLGWEQVAAVEWSRLTGVLQLPVWPDLDASPVLVSLGHRSRLPAFASEQMAACRILVQRVAVRGGCGAIRRICSSGATPDENGPTRRCDSKDGNHENMSFRHALVRWDRDRRPVYRSGFVYRMRILGFSR